MAQVHTSENFTGQPHSFLVYCEVLVFILKWRTNQYHASDNKTGAIWSSNLLAFWAARYLLDSKFQWTTHLVQILVQKTSSDFTQASLQVHLKVVVILHKYHEVSSKASVCDSNEPEKFGYNSRIYWNLLQTSNLLSHFLFHNILSVAT